MKRRVSYQWRLRQVMAEHNMFTTTDLVPLLAERGITLSASQVHRLVSGTPERLSLSLLVALCDILGTTPADLVVTRAEDLAPRRIPAVGDGRPMIIPAGQRPPTRGKLDLRGMLLLTAGLAALTYGLQEGQQYDWNTKITLVLALGVVLLAVFVVSQRNSGARQPVMPLCLLATRTFGLMNLSAVGLSVGIMSMAIGFQLYAQSVLGMSPLAAGAVSAPMSAVSVLLGPYAGRLSDRIGGRPMVFGGLGRVSWGAEPLSHFHRDGAGNGRCGRPVSM